MDEFDLAARVTAPTNAYATTVGAVETNSSNFLYYAQSVVEPKSRGGPFLLALPMIEGLVDLAIKLQGSLRAADLQQRELLLRTLEEKKWKVFNEAIK